MRQAIPLGPAGQSDASGSLTISFPSVPVSQTWVGSLSISGAPTAAVISASVNSLTYGTWTGANTFGPISVGANETLVVVATNLLPNTNYQPSFIGVVFTSEEPMLTWPTSNTSTTGVYFPQVPIGSAQSVLGTTTFTVQVQASWRSLYISGAVVNPSLAPITPLVTGVQSLHQYPVTTNGLGGADQFYYQVPLVPGLDQSVTVTYSGSIAGTTIYYGADFAPADQSVFFSTTPTVEVTGGSSTAVETYVVGGSLAVATSRTSDTATVLLAAPAAGTRYRIHLIAITGNGPTSQACKWQDTSTSFAELHMGSQNQQTLDGLLISSAITITTSGATASNPIGVHMRYDNIVTPTIT